MKIWITLIFILSTFYCSAQADTVYPRSIHSYTVVPHGLYYWSNECGDIISKNPNDSILVKWCNKPGTYKLTIVNQCGDSATLLVYVVKPNLSFYIPNTFTPNNDRLNDYFTVVGSGIKSVYMQIYNRWGELVFESFNPNDKWDGTFKGEKVIDGVYMYMMQIGFKDGSFSYISGEVNVLK